MRTRARWEQRCSTQKIRGPYSCDREPLGNLESLVKITYGGLDSQVNRYYICPPYVMVHGCRSLRRGRSKLSHDHSLLRHHTQE